MKTQNTILKAVNYLSIYETKNKNFNNFKFVGRSIDNPMKVSYIKQDKIDSLLEHTGKKIVGTKTQRKKYFTSTSIYKLLQSMFVIQDETRILTISTDIDKQLKKDFCSGSDLFFEDDVAGFYSQEITDTYIYNPNGSCMNKKPISYFAIYDKFINVETKIVGLKVGKSVIARAVLWAKTNQETGEKQYFLDRIYISKEFENSNKAELQSKLYNKVKRSLKLDSLNCYSLTHIKSLYKDVDKYKIRGKEYPFFSIQINQDTFFNLEYYPYMDSFRWGKETSTNIKFDADEDYSDYILEDTGGDYTESGSSICDCCGERFHEDDLHYSETEEEYLCDNCGTYIEERGEMVREENAVLNNYTGEYHYSNDLDY